MGGSGVVVEAGRYLAGQEFEHGEALVCSVSTM